MENQLASLGMEAEFIFDWDADELTDEIVEHYFQTINILSPAQKSCALKHILALEKIASSQRQFNLVLEDDAVFLKAFPLGLQRALAESVQIPGAKVVFIGSGSGRSFITPKSQRKQGQYLYPGNRGRYTDSYIIDSGTAQKRLAWIKANKIYYPIDDQFDKIDLELGIKILWLEDPVVEQGSKTGMFDSAIESPPTAWLKRVLFNLKNLKRKYIYQLWR